MKPLKNISLLFLVVMLVCPNDGIAQSRKSVEIENNLLKLVVDKSSRTWSLFENMFNTWKPIVSNASISLTFANGDSLNLITETGEIDTKIEISADPIGKGKSLTVRSVGSTTDWNLIFRLYDFKKILSLSAHIKNLSHESWKTKELHLVDIGGAGYLGFQSNTVLMQTNGYQSWSNCEIVALDSVAPKTSYWSAVFSEPDAFSSILFGFITNGSAVNSFHIGPLDFNSSTVHCITNSDIKTIVVPPGGEIHSDTLMISMGDVAIDLLQTYGEYLQTFAPSVNKAFTPNGTEPTRREGISSMPTGWCSWYYYYQNISEDSILVNLTVAARSLKEAGLQYIQIDDGYQIAAGDWNTNKKFPHGHKWLVDQIHGKGLLAGLWVAPFAIAESSTVYKQHPDWLLKDDGDTLKQFSANEWWGGKIYSLDPTKPEVQRWLTNLFYMIANTWG
ncbi:MAG TPA: glycoside hydrolase family 36 protein, partial [Bacteroidota bacterium]|nr:glycoside hydrolase family 36 protein [Bacteroidota bacterium]